MNGHCERCYEPTNITIGSMFNTEMVCMPCKEKEEAHPEYQKAKDTEMAEVRNGNYNYDGIGKPSYL